MTGLFVFLALGYTAGWFTRVAYEAWIRRRKVGTAVSRAYVDFTRWRGHSPP